MSNKINTDSLLTIKDFAANTIGKSGHPVTKQHIYNLIDKGKLIVTYVGGVAFLDKSQLK